MTGVYDPPQAALSVLIAISASYAALDLAGRVTAPSGRTRLAWLIGGSTAMGIGIWATHYLGMLAFHPLQEPESRPPAAYGRRLSRYSLVFKLTVENGQTSSPPIY
jgi:NO-binding membrane sensor protein with MHYT domain